MKTLEQLKSDAYDCLVQIEVWQKKLQEANQAVSNHINSPLEESKEQK